MPLDFESFCLSHAILVTLSAILLPGKTYVYFAFKIGFLNALFKESIAEFFV